MQDLADMPLIDTEDKITACLSNLMLTGSATPYLHNGIMSADNEDATNFEVTSEVDLSWTTVNCDLSSLEMARSASQVVMTSVFSSGKTQRRKHRR